MPAAASGDERLVAVVVELVAWWAVAVGVWMASLSAYSGQDLVVAFGCAVPCAAAALAARRAIGGAWRPPREMVRWALLLPFEIVAGSARILTLPLRRGARVGFRTVPLGATGDSPRASGRRAIATLLLSTPPASYVVRTDADTGDALVHAVSSPSPLERQVAS